jgi:RNA polymerase sigma-70 factor, ECF subfamily
MQPHVTPDQTVSPLCESAEVVGVDRLFREHSAYVAAFLRKLGLRDDAVDDAVQEVFLVAYKRGGYRQGPASPRTWLGAITIRVAANARRARQRSRETVDERVLENFAASFSPDALAEQREELGQVERALGSMSDGLREAFLRFTVAGHSCEEIARSQGVPTGTVYSRLHAARSSFSEVRASIEAAA